MTFAVTSSTRPEHTLLAHQNRCLQGVCKSGGAGVPHIVLHKIQDGEGGIRLVIFHSTNPSAQVAACVLMHAAAPVRRESCLQRNACEDARNLCATWSPVCCTKTYPLLHRENLTHKTLYRETSNARDVTLQARWQTLIPTVAPLGPLCTCSAFTAKRTKCLTIGTVPERVTSFGYVEEQDKFALMFWSDIHPHVMVNVTLTRISSKLPLVRSLLRLSRDFGRRSDVLHDDFVS